MNSGPGLPTRVMAGADTSAAITKSTAIFDREAKECWPIVLIPELFWYSMQANLLPHGG